LSAAPKAGENTLGDVAREIGRVFAEKLCI
jgi:hypothetical protein